MKVLHSLKWRVLLGIHVIIPFSSEIFHFIILYGEVAYFKVHVHVVFTRSHVDRPLRKTLTTCTCMRLVPLIMRFYCLFGGWNW